MRRRRTRWWAHEWFVRVPPGRRVCGVSDEIYHRVGSRIWHENWDDDMMLVVFYLLTNEHRSTEGLYRLPLAYGATDMRWPMKRFKRAFDALVTCNFVEYDGDAQVVLIVKALAWQQPANPNQRKSAAKKIKALPDTPLLKRFEQLVRTHTPGFGEWLDKEFPNLFQTAGEPLTEPLTKGVANR
jgi:hypothetical protein